MKSTSKNYNPLRGILIGAVMIAVAVIITVLSVNELKSFGMPKVETTVVNVIEHESYDEEYGSRTDYSAYVEYTVDGERYESLVKADYNTQTGDIIEARYEPDNPENLHTSTGGDSVLLFVVAGICLIIGIAFIVNTLKAMPKKKNDNDPESCGDSEIKGKLN